MVSMSVKKSLAAIALSVPLLLSTSCTGTRVYSNAEVMGNERLDYQLREMEMMSPHTRELYERDLRSLRFYKTK